MYVAAACLVLTLWCKISFVLQLHLENCTHFPVTCPNGCMNDKDTMLRQDVSLHVVGMSNIMVCNILVVIFVAS